MQIPQLTFLRFLAAVGVVVFHFGQTTFPFGEAWALPTVQAAGLGVGFFFTLSGFLLAWVYAPQPHIDLRKYAQARFARIYPLYLLTFLLALAAEIIFRDKAPRGLSIILQTLGLQAWVPGYSLTLNFPGWSVSVEFLFYLLFPWLLLILRKRSWPVLLGIAAAAWALGLLIFLYVADWTRDFIPNPNSDFTLRFPPWHLHSFIAGMVGGLLFGRWMGDGKPKSSTGPWWGLAFLLLSAFMVSLAYFPNWVMAHSGNGILAPLYVLVIASLARDRGLVAQALAWKPFQFLGEMSYAVYLLQAPVYIALEPLSQRMGASGLQGTWFWIYLGVLLLLSAAIYQWFERPMRDLLRRPRA